MKRLLKLENSALLIATLVAYHAVGGNWWLFLILILAPDLSIIGYLAGPRIGAWCYNTAHTWLLPVAIGLIGWIMESALAIELTLILTAHIAADRTLGYGLKRETSFQDTHLGAIGRNLDPTNKANS